MILCYASVTLQKKWAEPEPRPNLNFEKVKNSRLGRAFSAHYHTDLYNNLGKCVRMDQGGAYARSAHRLHVACTLPARLPCCAQTARRRGPPVAHPWPRRGPGGAQALSGTLPGKCSDRRENLRGKYGRKIVVDVNLLFSMKYTSKTVLAKVFILN